MIAIDWRMREALPWQWELSGAKVKPFGHTHWKVPGRFTHRKAQLFCGPLHSSISVTNKWSTYKWKSSFCYMLPDISIKWGETFDTLACVVCPWFKPWTTQTLEPSDPIPAGSITTDACTINTLISICKNQSLYHPIDFICKFKEMSLIHTCHSFFLPSQVLWSAPSVYPLRHSHLYDPSVFIQIPFTHRFGFTAHSFTSNKLWE